MTLSAPNNPVDARGKASKRAESRSSPHARARREVQQERTFRCDLSAENSLFLPVRRSAGPHIPISISWETATVPETIALMSVCKVTSSFAVLTETTNAYRVLC